MTDEKKLRKRSSYRFWKQEMDFLKQKPTPEQTLKHMHKIIDDHRGFHYQHRSDASWESLQQAIKDEVNKEETYLKG